MIRKHHPLQENITNIKSNGSQVARLLKAMKVKHKESAKFHTSGLLIVWRTGGGWIITH